MSRIEKTKVDKNSFVSVPLRLFRALASLKLAIPLLVVTAVISVSGTLLPKLNIFQSIWYLSLLGLLGVCLLCTTIERIPTMLEKKGRPAMIGVLTTHMGVLILLVGYGYGEFVGFRYSVKIIEGEMTVVPGLPFVIQLEKLALEEYSEGEFQHLELDRLPRKKQDSHLSLYKNGKLWIQSTAKPGTPLIADGITMLPSLNDVGWYFELIVTDQIGRESTIPVRPWAPPLLKLGNVEVMAHKVSGNSNEEVELFTLDNDQQRSLGLVTRKNELDVNSFLVRLGDVKRYTGMLVYQRPQMPILIAGFIVTMAGLIWHFYYRNRKLAIFKE
jgi:hypothetical protein